MFLIAPDYDQTHQQLCTQRLLYWKYVKFIRFGNLLYGKVMNIKCITHLFVARNYHLRIVRSLIHLLSSRQLLNNTTEMWYYIICVILVIVVWFLSILIFSEQIRKSVFAEFFTSRFISLWYESLFISLKYYQLEKFTEFPSDPTAGKLVFVASPLEISIHFH